MTRDAVVGRVQHAPAPIGHIPSHLDIEWLCVEPCGLQVAVSRVDLLASKIGAETWTSQFRPVRWPQADRDGLPYFGPGRRELKGKSTRRHPAKLAEAAEGRQRSRIGHRTALAWADPETARRLMDDPEYVIEPEFADYAPIQAEDFDTICMKCATRLHIRVASALPGEVSS